jgi:hypothetical protein
VEFIREARKRVGAPTDYFEQKVLTKRTYLKKEWCARIIDNPIRKELQPDGERVRFWGRVDEFEN